MCLDDECATVVLYHGFDMDGMVDESELFDDGSRECEVADAVCEALVCIDEKDKKNCSKECGEQVTEEIAYDKKQE